MHRFLTALAVITMMATLSAQAPPPAKPGPEHRNLERFVGTWKMQGTMNPGPLGPGGAFTGTETCRMFEGGFHLVCDTTGSGAMGEIKAHMILTYDAAAKKYRHFAVNNTPVAEIAEGTYANNTWTFRSQSVEGGKKLWSMFTVTEASPTQHKFEWKLSQDGKTWTTMMQGTSAKQ